MQIIAHRGASAEEPENSMAAFKKAIELGVYMVEIDIQKCKDGFVISHDDTFDRCTNKKGRISDMTLEEIGAQVKLSNNDSVPSLHEVCVLLKDTNVVGMLDIKSENSAIELYKLICKNFSKNNFIFASFHHQQLRDLKALDSTVKTCTIIVPDENLTQQLKILNVNMVSLCLATTTKEMVKSIQDYELPCYVWTVNSESDIEFAMTLDVDGIITDYPEKVSNHIGPSITN